MPTPQENGETRPRFEELSAEARALLAEDPDTTASQLQALERIAKARWNAALLRGYVVGESERRQEDRARAAIATNPNTPISLLAELATTYPEAFVRNPIASLLPLEDPGFVLGLNPENLPALLRRPDVPVTLLQALRGQSANPEVQEEASLHVVLTGEATPEEGIQEIRALLIRKAAELKGEDRIGLRALILHDYAPAWLLEESDETLSAEESADAGARAVGLVGQVRSQHEYHLLSPLLVLLVLAHTSSSTTNLRLHLDPSPFTQQPEPPPAWWARLGAALNPNIYDAWELLTGLIEDGNRLVRVAALDRLSNPNGRPLH